MTTQAEASEFLDWLRRSDYDPAPWPTVAGVDALRLEKPATGLPANPRAATLAFYRSLAIAMGR